MPITIICDFCKNSSIIEDLSLSGSLYAIIQSVSYSTVCVNGDSYVACIDCLEKVKSIIDEEEHNKKENLKNRIKEFKSKV